MSLNPPVNCESEGPAENPPKLSFAFQNTSNLVDGKYVPPPTPVGTLDYSTSECADKEADYVAGLMAEALNIAAGPVNIFPLLGVHNQGDTNDLVSTAGWPLSGGAAGAFTIANAFNTNDDAWRSSQTGVAVLSSPAFIGYFFGTKKAWTPIVDGDPRNDNERYMPSEPVRKKVSTLKIRQSLNPLMRATQLRVEASDNGTNWHRVDVVNVANSAALVTVGIRAAAAFSHWRFIPSFFNGVAADLPWEVIEVHLLESTQIALDNIQDDFLLENRDRAYCRHSTLIKCTYDLLDVQTELAKFGINLPQTYIFTCSFAIMVKALGRPVIVGDVIELPGEVQYDANLRPVRKWLEVTDASWSTEGYTNNWKPNLYKFYAQPIMPSVEHRDLLGLPGETSKAQSDASVINEGFLHNLLASEATEAIIQTSEDLVPQDGADGSGLSSGMPLFGKPGVGSYDGRELWTQDAIPPNGEPFTTGNALPTADGINDGHYHRQTYTNVDLAIRPPDRLLRWYADIQRWKVIEVNNRFKPESNRKSVAKIMNSPTRVNLDDFS